MSLSNEQQAQSNANHPPLPNPAVTLGPPGTPPVKREDTSPPSQSPQQNLRDDSLSTEGLATLFGGLRDASLSTPESPLVPYSAEGNGPAQPAPEPPYGSLVVAEHHANPYEPTNAMRNASSSNATSACLQTSMTAVASGMRPIGLTGAFQAWR